MKKAKAKKAGGTTSKKDDVPAATTRTSSDAPAAATSPQETDATTTAAAAEDAVDEDQPTSPVASTGTPSLAQQSKARSTSFRQGSISVSSPAAAGFNGVAGPLSPAAGPFSPEGETAPDIYRKHVSRIEELERENKRWKKEAAEAEKRWQRAEGELADLREADGEKGVGGEGEGKLVCFLFVSVFWLWVWQGGSKGV